MRDLCYKNLKTSSEHEIICFNYRTQSRLGYTNSMQILKKNCKLPSGQKRFQCNVNILLYIYTLKDKLFPR